VIIVEGYGRYLLDEPGSSNSVEVRSVKIKQIANTKQPRRKRENNARNSLWT
jgi:hypothetical protein